MKSISRITYLLPLLLFISQTTHAQPLPPDGVPIDPVSWVLLGGAAALSGKKYYDARRKNTVKKEDDF